MKENGMSLSCSLIILFVSEDLFEVLYLVVSPFAGASLVLSHSLLRCTAWPL